MEILLRVMVQISTLGDFTSYLDHSGSFYLGGGESGTSTPVGGYFGLEQ